MLLYFQNKGHKAIWGSKTKSNFMSIFKEIMKMDATNLLRIHIRVILTQIGDATKQCASKQLD